MNFLNHQASPKQQQIGLLILRVVVGAIFIAHGTSKWGGCGKLHLQISCQQP